MTIQHPKYTTVTSDKELEQILLLQQKNIVASISEEDRKKEGFVTVEHDFDMLKKMNDHQPHIIAKDNDIVVGYALCMTKNFGDDIAILKPMFSEIKKSVLHNKRYIIMGQVCVEKAYRGQGVFRGLYHKMKLELQETYDVLITEVAANNHRSLNAHESIGFKTLVMHDNDAIHWHLIYWDWE